MLMTTEQDLHILESKLTKLQQYSTRQKPTLSLQSLPTTNVEQFVSYINTEIQRESYLVDHLITEFSTIITSIYHHVQEYTAKHEELVKQHESTLAKVQYFKDLIGSKDKQIVGLQQINKSLQNQLHNSKIQLQNLHIQYTQEIEPIKQRLLDEQLKSESNLAFVSEIKQENQSISQVMRETYNEKTQLKEEILRLCDKVIELQGQKQKIGEKYTAEIKRREALQQTLRQKQKLQSDLYLLIEELKQQCRIPMTNNFNYELFSPPEDLEFEQQDQQKPKDQKMKLKLSEDVQNQSLQNKLETDMLFLNKIQNIRCVEFTERTMMKEEVNLVDSHLEKTISHTPSKSMIASKIKRNVVLDPYYCHYILLSQTIKVEQSQEDFFNIDIKPYYKQIIKQNIPMFEWKQWILDKFMEISVQAAHRSHLESYEDSIFCSQINYVG